MPPVLFTLYGVSIPPNRGFRTLMMLGFDPAKSCCRSLWRPGFDPTESWFRFLMMRGFVPVKSWGFDPCRPKVVVPTGTCGADVTRVSIPVSRARAAIWITDGPEGFDPGLPSLDSGCGFRSRQVLGFDPCRPNLHGPDEGVSILCSPGFQFLTGLVPWMLNVHFHRAFIPS